MSTVIDNRVLEMRFDNKQFESGVSNTLSTLDKLKQKLNLTGATKGLQEVSKATKNVDMSGLGRGIETIQAKFSALQVAGATAIANITNNAVNCGKRIANALTIEPIKTGFQEYETQMGAIQTILANTQSKGSTLQDVNRALNELNTYADKTIYNFTEMTKNIGTFTAAGVDLDKSVTSIKGIANLAAVSGSTSQQASAAMYQLSQALAAGKVSLMDWNSVVNAGMGGELFQNALKRTAKQMGYNVDAIIEKYGSFRESLTEGEWLTTEVLTETLTQLSGAYSKADLISQGYSESQAAEIVKLAETAVDAATEVKTFTQLWDTLKESVQSGWTQSWQTIIGDFGEAKELLTGISKGLGEMVETSSNARNKVLTEGLSSGWKQMLAQGISDEEGFKDSIKSVAKERGVAIDQMIEQTGSFEKSLKQGWITGDILTESLDKMTEKISGLSVEQLKERGYTEEQVKALQKLNESVKNGTIDMDEFAKKMTMTSGRENMIAGLKNIFDGLLSVTKPIKEAFRDIFPAMTGEQLYKFTEKFKEFTSHLKLSGEAALKLKSTFKGVFSVIDIVVEAIKSIGKGTFDLVGNFTSIGGGILDATSSFGNFLTNIRDAVVEGNLFGNAVDKIVGFLTNAIDAIQNFGSALMENIGKSSTFKGFLGFFEGLWNVIKSIGSTIGQAFGTVGNVLSDMFANGDVFEVINGGLFAGILLSIRNFIKGLTSQVEELTFMERIKNILDGVKDSLDAWQQDIKANTLLKIASAIGILAAALYVISGIDSDKLGQSLTAIGVLFGELLGSMALLNKLNDASLKPLAGIVESLANISRVVSMIGLGAAVLILAGAMKVIAGLDWEGVKKGMVGISVMVGLLVAAARLMNTESKSVTKFAGQMVILSVAVVALSGVAKILSSMSWEELSKGGAGILGIVGMLVAAAKIMDSNDKAITKFAGQMVIMSTAIAILTAVGKSISSMSWGELAKGGAGILGLITMLVAAAKIMSKGGASIASFGGQMLLMSASLAVLTPVLKSLGSMSWETIGKGLLTIGLSLAELSIGLKSMNGSIGGSAALLVAAAALAVLAPVLKSLGSMSVGSIAKSLITLAASFGIIGVAGYLLAPLVPTLLGLAGAFALFGIAAVGIGAGITAIAAGFTALATAGATGATAFVAALGVIVTGVIGLIPQIAQIIGQGIVEIARVIGDYAPQLAESFLKLITGVLSSLSQYTPQIVDSLLTFLIGVMNSLADHVPTLIQSAMNLIGKIFQGIVDALNGLDTSNLLTGVLAVGIMTALMYALSGVVALIPSAMTGLLGVGLVVAELALVLAAIGGLAQIPGLEWLIGEGGDLLQKIGTAIGQFVGGIVGGITKGATSSLPDIANNLSDFMSNLRPFIEGAKSIDPSIMDSVVSLGKAILTLTAADILDGIASFLTGGSSLSDFAEELVPFGEAMQEFSNTVKGIDESAVTAAANAGKMLAEMADTIPNSGGLLGGLLGNNDIDNFGEQLSGFGAAMADFSKTVKGKVDEASITAAVNAGEMLSEFADTLPNNGGLLGGIMGNNDLAAFAVQLIPFGVSMAAFSASIKGKVDESAVTSAVNCGKMLSEFADTLPNSGGLMNIFSGSNDLSTFGQQMVSFGVSMRSYSSAVSGIDTESINASVGAAKGIVEVANSIQNSSCGLFSIFTGDNSLANIGKQLVPFGVGMRAYSLAVSGMQIEPITASIEAAKKLVELTNNIQNNSGGLVTLFTGDNSLANIGTQLVPFGQGMKAYGESVSGIEPSSIVASASAAKALIALTSELSNSGGLVSLFTGDVDLGAFGNKLVPFGQGMKTYSEAVTGIDIGAISSSATAAKSLVQVAETMSNTGGVAGFFAGEVNLASFGKQLTPFGKGMKSYSEAVSGIDVGAITSSVTATKKIVEMMNGISGVNTSGVNSFVTALNTLGTANVNIFVEAFSGASSQLNSAGSKMIDSLINGIKSKQSSLKSTATTIANTLEKAVESKSNVLNNSGVNMAEGLIKGIKSKQPVFTTVSNGLINNFVNGIKSQSPKITTAITSALSTAVSRSRGYYSAFYSAGSYVVSGFTAGIRANISSAANAAASMAKAASNAARRNLNINSPSKVFYDIGVYAGQGFINALEYYKKISYKAGCEMSKAAENGLENSLVTIKNFLDGNINVQPTISPVMDLSNIEHGIHSIDSMINTQKNMSILSNLSSVDKAIHDRIQNKNVNNVIKAVDKLRNDLNSLERNSYVINGITYDDGSNISTAIEALIREAIMERRI